MPAGTEDSAPRRRPHPVTIFGTPGLEGGEGKLSMLGPQGLKPRIFQSEGSACPPWTQCGQGVMEFALLAGVLLLLVFGGLQMVLIFNAALSVSQYSYAAVRYAAVHGTGSSASSYGNILL